MSPPKKKLVPSKIKVDSEDDEMDYEVLAKSPARTSRPARGALRRSTWISCRTMMKEEVVRTNLCLRMMIEWIVLYVMCYISFRFITFSLSTSNGNATGIRYMCYETAICELLDAKIG